MRDWIMAEERLYKRWMRDRLVVDFRDRVC